MGHGQWFGTTCTCFSTASVSRLSGDATAGLLSAKTGTPFAVFCGKAALSTSLRSAKHIPIEERRFSYRMLASSAAFSRVSQPVVMPGTKALHASPSRTALPAGRAACL